MTEPKPKRTLAEALDVAAAMPDKGEAFGRIINSLFVGLENAIDAEKNDDR